MSDGDNATPGQWAPEGAVEGEQQLMTMTPGPAPWERWQAPAANVKPAPNRQNGPSRQNGTSRRRNGGTGSVSVADLIAKVNGDAPVSGRRSEHRAAVAPPAAPLPAARDWPAIPFTDLANVTIAPPSHADSGIPAPPAYASELPDLDRLHGMRPDGPAATTRLPRGAHEAPLTPATRRRGDLPPADLLPADLPPAEAPANPTGQPARTHRKAMLAGRLLAAMMAVLALVLTGSAWQWSSSKNRSLNHVSALDPHSHDILDPAGQTGDENFLIVGVDSRAGANSEVGAGSTDDAEGARSDTIMLVNIPASRKRVVVVSFPRDLAIDPIQCQVWNSDTGAYGPIYDAKSGTYSPDTVYTETKLNSTFAYGGPKCLVKEIQKLSGLAISRFIALDFVGFGNIVDALGGVDVCTTSPLYDLELGSVLENTGWQRINGATALNYVRARSVTTENNGDYGRIKRQQLFLSSLLRSMISSNTFFSPGKLNKVVDTFVGDSYVDNVTTKDVVNLAQSLQNINAGHITFFTIPTSGTDDNGDEIPRMDDIRTLFDAIINDDPLPGENDHNATSEPTTASGPTSKAPAPPADKPHSEQVRAIAASPADVTVRVSNATEETGLAATTAAELQHWGFNVDNADDYPGTLKTTKVLFSPGNEQAAATVASALSGAPIERVTGLGNIVRVVLGSNFRTASKPAPAGSPITVLLNRGASVAPTNLPDDLTVTNAADTTCE